MIGCRVVWFWLLIRVGVPVGWVENPTLLNGWFHSRHMLFCGGKTFLCYNCTNILYSAKFNRKLKISTIQGSFKKIKDRNNRNLTFNKNTWEARGPVIGRGSNKVKILYFERNYVIIRCNLATSDQYQETGHSVIKNSVGTATIMGWTTINLFLCRATTNELREPLSVISPRDS